MKTFQLHYKIPLPTETPNREPFSALKTKRSENYKKGGKSKQKWMAIRLLEIPHFQKKQKKLKENGNGEYEFVNVSFMFGLFLKIFEFSMADVLKVRLQMQLVGQRGSLIGMGPLFVQVMKNEGPKSLYLGLTPALTRSLLYGGLRLGLYEPSKYACDWAFGSNNILFKIASGAFAGAISTALTNPVEVLKVRLQMNSDLRQRGPIAEMRRIVSKEGIGALWKGVGPASVRAAALTASQLATYDESKQILVNWTPLEEGFYLHLTYDTAYAFFFSFLCPSHRRN
ncbi:hypothetical protein GOBAR_DD12263 [Gossypium barbadense]|nr:hypothetical protein GOBAR_DD12263 [Gossypium barbadense]